MFRSIAFTMLISLFSVYISMSQAPRKLTTGDLFPKIEGHLLSSEKISLPNHCKGKVSVLIIAFRRGTQPQIDSWIKPLLQEFGFHPDFRFIEIPMINGLFNWMSNYIDNGMREGIVESMHKNVMTYYGSLGAYYKYFNVQNNKLCYLFLLNKDGRIEFITKGKLNQKDLSVLKKKIKLLLESQA